MRRLQPIDIATLAYVAVATVALGRAVAIEPPTGWGWLVVAHGLLVLLPLIAPLARAAGPVGRFLGDWYPMLLVGGLYGELGVLTLANGISHDAAIQRLEVLVFGSQVSFRWIRETPNAALSWVLHLSYLSYYAVLYLSPLAMWLAGRRDETRRTILALMMVFYACYVVSLFFPVAGPRYAFALPDNAATAVWPARAAQWLLDHGDSWGVAFPSSHVAASVVATAMALRHARRVGLVMLPLTTGLVLAVVYGQFHYAVDALAGLVFAAGALAVMWSGARATARDGTPAGSVVAVVVPGSRLGGGSGGGIAT
ncbi:MAG: phosphatase PAP2 family protein [Gemmatimonadales bacterium]